MSRSLLVRIVGLAAVFAVLSPAAAALGATHIVTVAAGSDPSAIAADAGVSAEYVYDTALTGFAATLEQADIAALQSDARVLDVTASGGTSTGPGAIRSTISSAPPQFTSWGQDRMGLLDSPTAKVDTRDRRMDRIDVDIAIVDSGIESGHPDLNVAGGVNCLGDGKGWADQDGHGTLVSGFAAAIDNRFGVVGVAPGARVWAVRVAQPDGYIPDAALLCGLDWVAEHAGTIEVANLSLGDDDRDNGNCGDYSAPGRSDPLHQAICRVADAGVVIVAAAGNESMDARRSVPAAYPEVIAVSAITETDGKVGGLGPAPWCLPGEADDHLATFSNYGPAIDIAAPGVCVTSTYLGGLYATANGTSFATPHVSGAAALVMQNHPYVSPERVKELVLAAAAHDPIYGDRDNITEPVLHVGSL